MAQLSEIVSYCDDLLQIVEYQDYCPNGLQVAGRPGLRRLVSGVSASQALLDAAVARGADAVLVHHGWFWNGENPRIVGMKRRRMGTLLSNDISLIAYHLPLDGHPELGNNARLGALLGIDIRGRFGKGPGGGIAAFGELQQPLSAAALAAHIAGRLGRTPLHIEGGPASLQRIGWCSGGDQGWIEQAVALGLDGFISGEISEQTVHAARELGIHYFAAGHHATERYGVRALGDHLAQKYELDHEFVDIDNPV